jgi:hypothetical protein
MSGTASVMLPLITTPISVSLHLSSTSWSTSGPDSTDEVDAFKCRLRAYRDEAFNAQAKAGSSTRGETAMSRSEPMDAGRGGQESGARSHHDNRPGVPRLVMKMTTLRKQHVDLQVLARYCVSTPALEDVPLLAAK